jgi:hypothetical protein
MANRVQSLLNSPSIWVLTAIFAFVIGVQNNQKAWKSNSVIKYDVVSYYSYLPAAFIEKDITLSFINDSNAQAYVDHSQYWPMKAPNGKRVIKASMGMAVMYGPFFYVAHLITPPTKYEANGFTQVYQFAILISGLFYLFFGLLYLRKSLLLYYSERITAITIAVLYFGTNLLCYSTLEAAMSHEYNFFLFSVFIYFSILWHHQQKVKYLLIIGLSMGMLILVRPVNILFALFFVLYGLNKIDLIKPRFQLFIKYWWQILIIIALSFLVFLPQMLYWKKLTDTYLFNSYIGEWFYFSKPHLLQCLLGFKKGWLIYTPIMAFALVGIYFLKKAKSNFFVISIVLIPLYFYVISSWWCWWYGGSFGLRAMIDLYPLLAFSLAAFLNAMLYQRKLCSKITILFISLFIALNLFQTIQFHYNIIHYDGMNFKSYINSFGKTSKADCDRTLLKSPDYDRALKGLD